jgi:hypothetical protein
MTRISTYQCFCILLALLSATVDAQPLIETQQSRRLYQFNNIVSANAAIGGQTLSRDAAIDGFAINDARDIAFVASWSDAGVERTAVFTRSRTVASSGDLIDGRRIARISPTSLSITNGGAVGYEAEVAYPNRPPVTAIFVDRHYKVDLAQSGLPTDFSVMDNGEIVLKAAVAAPAVPSPTDRITQNIRKLGPLQFPGPVWGPVSRSPIPNVNPNVLTQRQPQKPPAKAPTSPLRACTTPTEFPMPPAWGLGIGDEPGEIITSQVLDPPAKTKAYQSAFFGTLTAPYRLVQHSADCKPQIITIIDSAAQHRIEVWTADGLLTHTKPDGYLDLPGFSGHVLPAILGKGDLAPRMNRKREMLFKVMTESGGFALLLATPDKR